MYIHVLLICDVFSVAACMTDDGISMLSEEFDADNDGKLTAEDKAMFFTSLVLNPESLLLQVIQY